MCTAHVLRGVGRDVRAVLGRQVDSVTSDDEVMISVDRIIRGIHPDQDPYEPTDDDYRDLAQLQARAAAVAQGKPNSSPSGVSVK